MFGIILKIIILIVLIVLSGVFSSSETALTTISPHRVRSLLEEGVRRASTLNRVLERKDKMLSTILVCNNIVNLTASALMTVLVQDTLGNTWVSVGTGVLTLVILIFGEVAPKTMATVRAEKLALGSCGFINALMIVLTPIVAAVSFLSAGVLRLMGVRKDEEGTTITEQELRTIVEVSQEEGIIEQEEKEIINNIFDFGDTVVREIMVPRINVVSVGIDASYPEVEQIFRDNFYTRVPVMDEAGEKALGILNMKDFIFYDAESEFRVSDLMRDADFTFENKHLSELFMEMKDAHIAMEIVLDEYGDTAGIVTLEDVIEEIVGDIRDEYDEDEEQEIVSAGDGAYLVHGHVSLDDVNDEIGTKLESDDYDSIGGLLIERLGRIPVEGDSVEIDNPFGLRSSETDDDSDNAAASGNGDRGEAARTKPDSMTITAVQVNGTRIEQVKLQFLDKN